MLIACQSAFSQLGFCSGDKGDPVFNETFGEGQSQADPTAIGTTTYSYVPNGQPPDGSFTISDQFNWYPSWFTTDDHTEGDANGNALIVNADDTMSGRFFSREITGLCAGTTYEFSAWVMNVSSSVLGTICEQFTGIPGGIPINLSFEIWDSTDTMLLKSGSTGEIFAVAEPTWIPYGLTFQTVAGQEDIILKILNNGIGGCGNDLAIDDIQFASCGDKTEISNNLNLDNPAQFCGVSGPGIVTLKATPDFSVFSTHFYQWQQSNNGINFFDVSGETTNEFTTPAIIAPGDYYYRVKVAENLANLANNKCNSASEPFVVQVRDRPALPSANPVADFCDNDLVSVSVINNEPNSTINWYDTPTAGSVLATGENFSPGNLPAGIYTYYAETTLNAFECTSSPRTEFEITVAEFPVLNPDVEFSICIGETIELDSEINNVTYLWSTSATTKTIQVNEEGNYSITVQNTSGCEATRNFTVSFEQEPKIIEIRSQNDQVIIETEEGNFEYSIDNGNTFQTSPIFENVETNTYTAVVRDTNGCGLTDQKEFFHLNVPKFFTPNNDFINDLFELKSIKNVSIYDRYGKLLLFRINTISWNGIIKGKPVPSDDYWYLVTAPNDQIFTGHVTLKR